jgi:hypothetical protein
MNARPFAGLRALHPASTACQLDAYFPEYTEGEWRLLALEASDAVELSNGYDPVDDPPKRRRAHHGTPQSTSTASGRVTFDHPHDDPLKQIPASQYLPVLTGEVVSPSGRTRCPRPDHPDEQSTAC